MFKRFQLRPQSLFTLIIFLGVIGLHGIAFAAILNHQAEVQITEKALLLQKTINAVRDYTQVQIRPQLKETLQREFLPQMVPSYSAKEVFEIFQNQDGYHQFSYKEATLNPTNLEDKANGFEAELVEKFRQNPDLKSVQGIRSQTGMDLFYLARPLAIDDPKCLDCHSTPAKAPASQIAQYGNSNGFGWKLNEIVAAQMIYLPSNELFKTARQSWILIMGIVVLIWGSMIGLLNRWWK